MPHKRSAPDGTDEPLKIAICVAQAGARHRQTARITAARADRLSMPRRAGSRSMRPRLSQEAAAKWTLHADGEARRRRRVMRRAFRSICDGIRARCAARSVIRATVMRRSLSGGLQYGPAFRGITRLDWSRRGARSASPPARPVTGRVQIRRDLSGTSGAARCRVPIPRRRERRDDGKWRRCPFRTDASDGSVLASSDAARDHASAHPWANACWAHVRDSSCGGWRRHRRRHRDPRRAAAISARGRISGFRCKRIAGSRTRESLDRLDLRASVGAPLARRDRRRARCVEKAPERNRARARSPRPTRCSARNRIGTSTTRALLPRLPAVTVAFNAARARAARWSTC